MYLRDCTPEDIEYLEPRAIEPSFGAIAQKALLTGYTLVNNDKPVACGGIVELWPGVANAWLIFTREAVKCRFTALSIIKDKLLEAGQKYHRIQFLVQADFRRGRRLARWLGFRPEARLRKFTPEKKDCILYVLLT